MKERQERLSWDGMFMEMAKVAAQRSPDPDYQVGCVIATQNNVVVATGYNGSPRGIDPKIVPWDSEEKHYYVCHAEANAIINANGPVEGCKMYTVLFPCFECMKLIIQGGIQDVYYFDDSKLLAGKEKFTKSKELAELANIALHKIDA